MTANNQHVQLMLQPVIDLFGAADGGVAFTILRHDILPAVMDDPKYQSQVDAFQTVSEICKKVLALNGNVQRNSSS